MAKKRRRRQNASGKGALIKGMSKKLPSELFDSPIFRDRLKELMRKNAGLYALYRKDKLYYVGLTKNLWGRIRGHLKDRHKGKWDHFIIFRIKKVSYLKDLETLLQRVAAPPGNRNSGKVPRDADLNRILREELSVHTRAINSLKNAIR